MSEPTLVLVLPDALGHDDALHVLSEVMSALNSVGIAVDPVPADLLRTLRGNGSHDGALGRVAALSAATPVIAHLVEAD